MAIDFSKAYTAEWRLYRVNPITWLDERRVDGFVSASITRDVSGDAPEIESGTFAFEVEPGTDIESGYYRLVMAASQSRGFERIDVATMLCETDGEDYEYGIAEKTVDCRSVLHPAAVAELPLGDFAAKGSDGAQEAARMLGEYINAPVSVDGSFTLDEAYIFEPYSKVLDAVWTVLNAGNFMMKVNGRGEVSIGPMPSEPSVTIGQVESEWLEPSVSRDAKLSDIPNRFTAYQDGVSATVYNDEPWSRASYRARGYWVCESDSSPTLIDGETLPAYAARKLEELSILKTRVSYSRVFIDGILPYDVVRGSLQSSGLSGDMRIVSQSLECGEGITVGETAEIEEALWLA